MDTQTDRTLRRQVRVYHWRMQHYRQLARGCNGVQHIGYKAAAAMSRTAVWALLGLRHPGP